jgi:ADP-heptose:LPS heptosyltransferase
MPQPLLTPSDPLLVAAPVEWREACLSMPAIRALRRMGVALRVMCPQRQAGLWRTSGFEELWTYPDKASARQIAGLLDKAEASLAWEAGEAADTLAKVGIPRRLGPALKGLEKRLTEALTVVEPPGPIQHRVKFYLGLVEKLGAEAMVAENFAPVMLDVPRAVDRVLLVPDSDFGPHYEWLPERWEELARELAGRGKLLRIAVSGKAGAALAKAVPEVEAVSLELPGLEELASHGLCIAADGSVPHLAAHVGTRCVVLFGPGEPEWMRPLGKQHRIARRKVECSPCFASKCVMDLRCQNDLETREVMRVVGTLG